MKLRDFQLTGDWLPLLNAIGAWKKVNDGLWSDGEESLSASDMLH
jgi:hypothetical protein